MKQEKNQIQSDIDILARKIRHQPPLIRIGKNGITTGIIIELKTLVKTKKAVKVKILQNASFEDFNVLFEQLEKESGLTIWRSTGKTAIFI